MDNGHISDRYGRKFSVLLTLILEAVFGTISAFVPYFWLFVVCRFLIGISLGGTVLCCYVLMIELSGKSFRPYFCGINELSYVTAYLFLGIIAYYIRDWRYLQMATSVPWVIVIFYFWAIPESPRWLITVGKKDEAIELLSHIAKRNKMPTENIPKIVEDMEQETLEEAKEKGSYLDLFKTSKIRKYTLISAMVWLCTAHVFFGVNQYMGRLEGNLYLNVIFSALALLPSLLICVASTMFCNRKPTVIIYLVTTAACLVIFVTIPDTMTTLSLILAIFAQAACYNAFTIEYLYTTEIFPTVIRNSALGFASMFARIGSFITPYVVDIEVEWISITVFISLSLLGAFLCFFLPETRSVVLLNTIKQTEKSKDSCKIKA